jgi:hypothetical protein
MFEPMHSLAVMNTLALDLFIHPLTHDLEFQDRNPFLLYKSNNGNSLSISENELIVNSF